MGLELEQPLLALGWELQKQEQQLEQGSQRQQLQLGWERQELGPQPAQELGLPPQVQEGLLQVLIQG